MNKVLTMLALPLFTLLAACGGDGTAGDAAEQQGDLVGAKIGGPFTLIDQNGAQVTWDSFRGRYPLVYFGYTYCPDICPVDLQHIMQGFSRFEKAHPARAAKVQPILITVDPKRDTPAVLKTYVAAFHPRLIGLTGTPEQIAKVAKDFVVIHEESAEGNASDYLVNHSRTPYLFGPDGKPIALVPVGGPPSESVKEGDPADKIAAFLEKWVK